MNDRPTMTLKVNPRFNKLCRPLTSEEHDQLEANIVGLGYVREEILIWKNQIIDGHNRYEIAVAKKIDYHTANIEFEDENAACIWIIHNQLGRRNLNPEESSYLRGVLYNGAKHEQAGHPPVEGNQVQNEPIREQGSTAAKIAEETGVSASTIKRDGKKADALDSLPEWFREGYRKGDYKATEAALKKAAKLSQGELGPAMRVVRTEGKSLDEALGMNGKKSKAKTSKEPKPDYGKCPACTSTKWKDDDGNVVCAKCGHAHGEPAGDVDDKRVSVQRSKTIKTVEALMRAFDDLNLMLPKPQHGAAIERCKSLLTWARDWK